MPPPAMEPQLPVHTASRAKASPLSALGTNLKCWGRAVWPNCSTDPDPPKGIAVWAHAGGAAFGAVATAVWANDGTLWPLLSPAILLMALL